MKSIRNVLGGTLLAGGALLAGGSFSVASLAQTTATTTTSTTPGHAWGPGRIYSKLGLSSEQQSQIQSIFAAAKPQMQSLHQQEKANHLQLQQTKPDDPNYATVVASVAQTNATLASQRTTQMSEVRAQIYAILTPTQRTQLATLEAQWAANPHHGHHHGPGADAATAAAQ